MNDRDDPPYYTLEEIAKRLRVTVATVRRYVRAGRLDAVRLGREYRVRRDALDRFLREASA